jgi:hypothetical protein
MSRRLDRTLKRANDVLLFKVQGGEMRDVLRERLARAGHDPEYEKSLVTGSMTA